MADGGDGPTAQGVAMPTLAGSLGADAEPNDTTDRAASAGPPAARPSAAVPPEPPQPHPGLPAAPQPEPRPAELEPAQRPQAEGPEPAALPGGRTSPFPQPQRQPEGPEPAALEGPEAPQPRPGEPATPGEGSELQPQPGAQRQPEAAEPAPPEERPEPEPEPDHKAVRRQRSALPPPPGSKRPRRSPTTSDAAAKLRAAGAAAGSGAAADGAEDTDTGLSSGQGIEYHDMVLRIEFAGSTEMKLCTVIVMIALVSGIAITIYTKVPRTTNLCIMPYSRPVSVAKTGTSWYLQHRSRPAFQDNLITGCVCVFISGAMWILYVVRGLWFRIRRLRWDHRRHRMYWMRLAELSCILLSFACWTFASDTRRLQRNCQRRLKQQHKRMAAPGTALAFAAGEGVLYIDAPWLEYLSPFLWLWLPFQCLVGVNLGVLSSLLRVSIVYTNCLEWFVNCKVQSRASFMVLMVMLIAQVIYALVYMAHCLRAFAYLRTRSYVLYRQLNIYLSVEVRIRGFAVLFVVVNEIVQAFYVPAPTPHLTKESRHDCRFSLDALLGAVLMVFVVILAWLFIPRSVTKGMPVLQQTLQRFAWTEPDRPRQLARRLASVPQHLRQHEQLAREPMFCFETAVKLIYWCEHAYYYDEPGCEMRLPVEKLMELYELEGMETPYYQRSAWADTSKLALLSAVHHGFQWSWCHNGFNRRVLDWVLAYRARHPHGKVLVTGHSLGGAHATLCTLDIIRELGAALPYNHITCYTFGAPRIGNHAFAAMYDKVVYETWNVINCNDMVPLSPKCVGWFVYKHPGHKVIVKRRGDLIVRPTFTENAVASLAVWVETSQDRRAPKLPKPDPTSPAPVSVAGELGLSADAMAALAQFAFGAVAQVLLAHPAGAAAVRVVALLCQHAQDAGAASLNCKKLLRQVLLILDPLADAQKNGRLAAKVEKLISTHLQPILDRAQTVMAAWAKKGKVMKFLTGSEADKEFSDVHQELRWCWQGVVNAQIMLQAPGVQVNAQKVASAGPLLPRRLDQQARCFGAGSQRPGQPADGGIKALLVPSRQAPGVQKANEPVEASNPLYQHRLGGFDAGSRRPGQPADGGIVRPLVPLRQAPGVQKANEQIAASSPLVPSEQVEAPSGYNGIAAHVASYNRMLELFNVRYAPSSKRPQEARLLDLLAEYHSGTCGGGTFEGQMVHLHARLYETKKEKVLEVKDILRRWGVPEVEIPSGTGIRTGTTRADLWRTAARAAVEPIFVATHVWSLPMTPVEGVKAFDG
ncbi:hypothetical protein TSOC_006061 [Tetrabaena socialis]|uniref:Uncharacterized protein n=1 Tax=Tetrabaena socialis TaxID=47790 RepID=A0A2J8A4N4_9CHLO|nr:hypothetical protein TSOC_006061 [Tetrabaena socialis]|eukprot:PNH07480.1 hypothetical protein TSOC_006061 [Tetrabaena socialis]